MNWLGMFLSIGAAGFTVAKEVIDSKERDKKDEERVKRMVESELNRRLSEEEEKP